MAKTVMMGPIVCVLHVSPVANLSDIDMDMDVCVCLFSFMYDIP